MQNEFKIIQRIRRGSNETKYRVKRLWRWGIFIKVGDFKRQRDAEETVHRIIGDDGGSFEIFYQELPARLPWVDRYVLKYRDLHFRGNMYFEEEFAWAWEASMHKWMYDHFDNFKTDTQIYVVTDKL